MLPKPPECNNCTMYGDGRGFVPDERVNGATIMILAQNPGVTEEMEGRPLCGKTGQLMESEYFPRAGLERGVNVSLANVLKCRWNHGNKLPPAKILKPAVAQCMAAHLRIPETVTHLIAMGGLAWSALGQPGTITAWRGFVGESPR